MQKQPKILNYKNLMFDKYEYLQPHKTNSGNYISICNYKLSRNELLPFLFETPKIKLASGIMNIDNKYYLDLELSQTNEIGLFYQFILKNDDHNIDVCHCNSKEWFGHTMPISVIQNYYKSPIILRSNGLLPIIRVRLPSYKGNILTELYNVRKERIDDLTIINEGDYIMGIIEYTGLSFGSQIFSPCYELQKIKIYKDNENRNIPTGYLFSDTNEKVDIKPYLENEENIIKSKKILIPEQSISIQEPSINIISPIKEEIKNIDITKITIPEPSISIKEQKVNAINDDLNIKLTNGKTLFEMIKSATLKDILNDEDIFMNNNKFITEIKNKHKPIIKNNIKINKEAINNVIKEPINNVSKEENILKINDIDNINLDVNLEINNILSPSPEDNIISSPENEVNNSDSDEDGINYDSLNDLEVIVFEE